MEPIEFPQTNCTYAEKQEPYFPLPAYRGSDGRVITCWRLTLRERLKLLFTGKLWLLILTFNQPLQPVTLTVEWPFITTKEGKKDVDPGPEA